MLKDIIGEYKGIYVYPRGSNKGGLKHYYKKSNLSIHSTFSIKRMFLNNEFSGTGVFNVVSGSLSLEYNISKWAQIKLGGVGVIDDAEGNNEFWAFPFTGINFTF